MGSILANSKASSAYNNIYVVAILINKKILPTTPLANCKKRQKRRVEINKTSIKIIPTGAH